MATFKVTSLARVREVVQDVPWDVNPSFVVSKTTSLADAHELLGHVSTEGGHGTLLNPELLLHKEAALDFVQRKLTHLRRWKKYLESKLPTLDEKLGKLKTVMEAGGPGVRAVHEPASFKGDYPCVDTEQVIDEKDMKAHVAQMTALILDASPGSPTADGYGSVGASIVREKEEQLDIARFNAAYLEVKREGVELLRAHLDNAINKLEDIFVRKAELSGRGERGFRPFRGRSDPPGRGGSCSLIAL